MRLRITLPNRKHYSIPAYLSKPIEGGHKEWLPTPAYFSAKKREKSLACYVTRSLALSRDLNAQLTHSPVASADSVSPFTEVDLSASSIVSDYPIWANNNNLINDDSNSNYHLLRAHRVSHCAERTFMY